MKSWPGPAEPAAKRASHSAAQGACQVSGAGEDLHEKITEPKTRGFEGQSSGFWRFLGRFYASCFSTDKSHVKIVRPLGVEDDHEEREH